MTNYEKYQDEIINLLSDNMAMDKATGKIGLCVEIECKDCQFNSQTKNCNDMLVEFLKQEAD